MKCKVKRKDYELEVLCGRMNIWEVPVHVRRGAQCDGLYIMAFRRCRDHGGGIREFWQTYNWWIVDMCSASLSEREHLLKIYRLFLRYGEQLGAFTDQNAPLPILPDILSTKQYQKELVRLSETNLPFHLGMTKEEFLKLNQDSNFQREVMQAAEQIMRKHLPERKL